MLKLFGRRELTPNQRVNKQLDLIDAVLTSKRFNPNKEKLVDAEFWYGDTLITVDSYWSMVGRVNITMNHRGFMMFKAIDCHIVYINNTNELKLTIADALNKLLKMLIRNQRHKYNRFVNNKKLAAAEFTTANKSDIKIRQKGSGRATETVCKPSGHQYKGKRSLSKRVDL